MIYDAQRLLVYSSTCLLFTKLRFYLTNEIQNSFNSLYTLWMGSPITLKYEPSILFTAT